MEDLEKKLKEILEELKNELDITIFFYGISEEIMVFNYTYLIITYIYQNILTTSIISFNIKDSKENLFELFKEKIQNNEGEVMDFNNLKASHIVKNN
ncbi:MAG: hypothetical protein KC589_09755 [Nanoarchaeota archaeon]|nr:hypothetical protein [Nanoarchaeota archaeon]